MCIRDSHKVCDVFLTETLQEISDLKPQKLRGCITKFLPPYMAKRYFERLERIVFEHNSIILALSDYLFSPLPDITNLVEISKLNYLLTPSLKSPFYLKSVAKVEDVKHHTLLFEAVCELWISNSLYTNIHFTHILLYISHILYYTFHTTSNLHSTQNWKPLWLVSLV